MFKKIVVGLDGSEASENALRIACDIAQKYDSELHLIHAPQNETAAYAMGAVSGYYALDTLPTASELKEAGEKVLAKAKEITGECKVADVKPHLMTGSAADQIVDCANACGADLIVTGRRGLGSVGTLIQGSTVARVNHLAKCATLSVV